MLMNLLFAAFNSKILVFLFVSYCRDNIYYLIVLLYCTSITFHSYFIGLFFYLDPFTDAIFEGKRRVKASVLDDSNEAPVRSNTDRLGSVCLTFCLRACAR